MSEFIDPLYTREIDDRVFQIVNHVFRYRSNLVGLITVPIGFYTDFESMFRWIPSLYALLGDIAHQPSVVHDWLYYSAITTRKMSDDVYFEAMELIGIPAYKRYPIWWGLRVGGWRAWHEHRLLGHSAADFKSQ